MLLLEFSNKEFLKRYKLGKPFAIISAFQGNLSPKENLKNNVILRRRMFDRGYDVLRVQGKYLEDDSIFDCMIVFQEKDTPENFLEVLAYYGKRFYQNGFIYVDKDSTIWTYGTKPRSTFGGMRRKTRHDKFYFAELPRLIQTLAIKTYEIEKIRLVND